MEFIGSAIGIPDVKWRRRWNVTTPSDLIPIAVYSLAAAFFEEVFYRSYAITRLYSLTGNLALSAAISIIFFTLIHYFFGPRVMLCILG